MAVRATPSAGAPRARRYHFFSQYSSQYSSRFFFFVSASKVRFFGDNNFWEGQNMSRPIRDTNPEKYRLITIRVVRAELMLTPNGNIPEIIGGIIAKYQQRYGILIFAYCVLSNHYHLLVRAPLGNLWLFEQSINREIALRINRLRGREGSLWGRRYDDLEVVETTDLLEAFLYIVCNPSNHGLVDHPKHWPGLNCYWQALDGKSREFKFTNYTAWRKGRERNADPHDVKLSEFEHVYTLTLSRLPQFENCSIPEYAERIDSLISERLEQIRTTRRRQGQGFLGRKAIRFQSPNSIPQDVKRSSRPAGYTKSVNAIRVFLEFNVARITQYKIASKQFRGGDLLAQFPPFCFKPPLIYCIQQ